MKVSQKELATNKSKAKSRTPKQPARGGGMKKKMDQKSVVANGIKCY